MLGESKVKDIKSMKLEKKHSGLCFNLGKTK